MGFLSDQMIESVKKGECNFIINASYDVILKIQKLYQEELLDNYDKLHQALTMLVVNYKELKRLGIEDKVDLLNKIYKECIDIKQKSTVSKPGPPVFDFEEDGEMIYSSFMSDYGIDLLEEQGRLHWKKFLALFQGLTEKTKMREVMRIRSMKVPSYNGHNQKEIQELLELKSYYALGVKGHGGQEGLDTLFAALEGMAVKE